MIDYFDRRRKNMFARSSGDLPTVVGAEAPLENVNSVQKDKIRVIDRGQMLSYFYYLIDF